MRELIFRRSFWYDQFLKRKKGYRKPSDDILNRRYNVFHRFAEKYISRAMDEIQRCSKLRWNDEDIVCYVSYGVRPFSDPLTITLDKQCVQTFHDLIHELTHCILTQNGQIIERGCNALERSYSDEHPLTRSHIAVHAIEGRVAERMFGGQRLTRLIEDSKCDMAYYRAWEIVQKDGAENIIRALQ